MTAQYSKCSQQMPRLMHSTHYHVRGSPQLGFCPVPCCRTAFPGHYCSQVQYYLLAWPARFPGTAEPPTWLLCLLPLEMGS